MMLYYLFFSTVTMSIGWALRGTIGGGMAGAFIPGGLIAMALCLLLGRTRSTAWVAACCVLGIGIGGQMTYGQTIGLIRDSETFWWGFTGLTTKGAIWGLFGGLLMGAGFMRHELNRRDYALSLVIASMGSWIGWYVINRERLINFSYKVGEAPRGEIWAGLLAGAICFLMYFVWRGKARMPLWFGMAGMIFGGYGFGLGGTFQAWGMHLPDPYKGYSWWKIMEYFFGAMLGLGYGWVAYIHRAELSVDRPGSQVQLSPAHAGLLTSIGYTAMTLLMMYMVYFSPLLGGFILVCALLLLAVYGNYGRSWQLAITLTAACFFHDLARAAAKEKVLETRSLWFWLGPILATWVVAWLVARWSVRDAKSMLPKAYLLLLWAALIVSFVKHWLDDRYRGRWEGVVELFRDSAVQFSFLICGIVLTVCLTGWLLVGNEQDEQPATIH